MDELTTSALKECAKLALTPATVFGAGGGLIRAIRRRGSWKQVVTEMLGGVVVANVLFPVAEAYLPPAWHYTAFFLVGWGGIEMVGWAYTSAAEFVRLWALRRAGLTVEELERLRHSDSEHNSTPTTQSGTPAADTPSHELKQENEDIR